MSYLPMKTDPTSGSIVASSYEHYEIHSGNAFYCHDVINLGSAATQDFLITTPNTTKWAHFEYQSSGTGGYSLELFEGADRTGTTLLTMVNRNRNSLTTATTTLHRGTSGGTTDGTRIGWKRSGSNTLSGSSENRAERVLKQATKYIFRVTSHDASNYISLNFGWYEHTNL